MRVERSITIGTRVTRRVELEPPGLMRVMETSRPGAGSET